VGIAYPTAAKGMKALVELGIARELTGRKRNRIFVYSEYLAMLSEGTEPPRTKVDLPDGQTMRPVPTLGA